MKFKIPFFILFIFLQSTLNAQVYSIMHDLEEDEKRNIEAIALYPEEERNAILEASTHPEILIRMQYIKRKTESQFREMIASLSKEDQQKIYSLSRYPQLIEAICANDEEKTKKEMELLTQDYPEEIQKEAIYINRKYFDELHNINNLYLNSQSVFEELIKPYDETLQYAYLRLLKLPEVVSILTENMALTVLLGDAYIKDPILLKLELDSLNSILAEQKARELNEWKQYLEDNPDAMIEFEEATQEFAEEEGYTEVVYDDNYYNQRVSTEIYMYPYWQAYPFWFGWPWWYTYECWYPYPWWYHWGYYYGPGNVIVFVGLPSSYFMYWHFAYYSHCYYYPNFTNVVVNYYYNNPDLNNSITSSVDRWESKTRDDLPDNWLENKEDRVERIREYGKFKMGYSATVNEMNRNTPSQKEYLKSNQNQYPELEPIMKGNQGAYYIPANEPEKIKSKKDIQARQKVIEQKPLDYQKIDRARIYHQNMWDLPQHNQKGYSNPKEPNTKDPEKQRTPKSKYKN